MGCPKGTECLAARCTREGATPVEPTSERVVLTPTALALASDAVPVALGPSVTLGNTASAPVALYLLFERRWPPGSIDSAFLVLEPSGGALAGPDLELEVWRAERAWKGPGFKWSEQPGLSPPFSRGIARSAPPMPVRIDVTSQVAFLAAHPARDFGLVLRARSERSPGVTLSTGLGGGAPPRLDVYVARSAQARPSSAQ
jgi:hypothetical protein